MTATTEIAINLPAEAPAPAQKSAPAPKSQEKKSLPAPKVPKKASKKPVRKNTQPKIDPAFSSFARSINDSSVPDDTLSIAVTLDSNRLQVFIFEALSNALRARPSVVVQGQMLTVGQYLISKMKVVPTAGIYPWWYLELVNSCRDKTVGNQGYKITVPGSVSYGLTDRFWGWCAMPDPGNVVVFGDSRSVTRTSPIVMADEEVLQWMVDNSREIGGVDAAKYKPRNRDCVSVCAFSRSPSIPSPLQCTYNVCLEVPIHTKWIGCLGLASTSTGRLSRYCLENVPSTEGTIGFLVRNGLHKHAHRVVVKAYDPNWIMQRLQNMLVACGQFTTAEINKAMLISSYSLYQRLNQFFGINCGFTGPQYPTQDSRNSYPNSSSLVNLGPGYASTFPFPQPLADEIANVMPCFDKTGNLYLPVFLSQSTSIVINGVATKWFFQNEFTSGNLTITYDCYTPNLEMPSSPYVYSKMSKAFKVTTLAQTKLHPHLSIMRTTFMNRDNSQNNRQFSHDKLVDTELFRVNKWAPHVYVPTSNEFLIGTAYDEGHCYPITFLAPVDDFHSNATKFASLYTSVEGSAVPNQPHDSDVWDKAARPYLEKINNNRKSKPYGFAKKAFARILGQALTYGNYGGLDWTAGEFGGEDFSKEPIDAHDAAYRIHDLEYYTAENEDDIKKADQKLYNSLTNLPGSTTHPFHWLALKYFAPYTQPPKDTL